MRHTAAAPLTDLSPLLRRQLYISPFDSQLKIFNALTLNLPTKRKDAEMQLAPSKIPGIFAESGQAGATQAATVAALRISFVEPFAEAFGRVGHNIDDLFLWP
jgi:hypothetical protein